MSKKLFLLDAYALIYRAYYAFINAPMRNSKGQNTSAIYGFVSLILDLIEKEKPTHLMVVFDSPEGTERATEFDFYKAHREEMPEDIALSIPYIKEILKAMNIPYMEMPGFEADDLAGTLAKKGEKQGFKVYLVTSDKDYAQLVSDKIFWYKPARMGSGVEILGVKEVCEKFEVEHPEQVIDILALWGDSVDNIPGIPGVGEKTAKKLIQQFGTIENMFENTEQIAGKLREKVEQGKESAIISKKLATIITDLPVELDENDVMIEAPNVERIRELFAELEFRKLTKRVLGEELNSIKPAADSPQMDLFADTGSSYNPKLALSNFLTINDVQTNYQKVDTDEALDDLIQYLMNFGAFCFDTEATALEPLDAELVGIAFAAEKNKAFYIPLSSDKTLTVKVLKKIAPLFSDVKYLKIGQNIKYDIQVLANYDVEVNNFADTMIAHYLLQPDLRHNMDFLAETYLNYRPISITTLIGSKGKNQGNMRDVEVDKVVTYACEDADITFQLYQIFLPKLKETDTYRVFTEVEMPLIPVLAKMERTGIKLDKETLLELSKDLQSQLDALESTIYQLAGETFNLNSPKQLGTILFEKLKIDTKAKKTKTGQYITNEETLLKLADKNPIINQILSYRTVQKLKSTYVDALPELMRKDTERIHTSFNQAVAATGRLSSQNPNLQNIPIRSEQGREIRKAFVPANDNYLILAADYSQVELRVIASLANETSMIEDFKKGLDIHAATAARIYGVDVKEVDKEMRRKAKMVNFGIIYGISAFGLSQRLGISRGEAADIIQNYNAQYPAIKQYMDSQIELARKQGFVTTILNRRRYLPDITSANATVRGFAERNAINAPIQGSAADIIKLAMIKIHKELIEKKLKSKMLLQVHDELVFDAHKSEIETLTQLVKHNMQNAYTLQVPLEVEVSCGANWLEAH